MICSFTAYYSLFILGFYSNILIERDRHTPLEHEISQRGNVNMATPAFPDISTGPGVSFGTEENDLFSGSGNNVLYTLGGDDGVRLGGGNDIVSGGEGNDVLYVEGGNDLVYGELGDDLIYGGAGDRNL